MALSQLRNPEARASIAAMSLTGYLGCVPVRVGGHLTPCPPAPHGQIAFLYTFVWLQFAGWCGDRTAAFVVRTGRAPGIDMDLVTIFFAGHRLPRRPEVSDAVMTLLETKENFPRPV